MQSNEFHYRLARRARGLRPGSHPGVQHGDGQETVAHVDLLQGRDPRRLDVLASTRDPMRRLLVRVARQRTAVPVYVLADLSASMGVARGIRKLDLLADFTAALAQSVYRSGDTFAFFGCDETVCKDFNQPLSRARGNGLALAERLRTLQPVGRSAAGLLAAAAMISRRDALVFLVSDFFMDVSLTDAILRQLSRYQVVPIVLGDGAEAAPSSRFGIAKLLDPESGAERTVVMRPGLGEHLRARALLHRDALDTCFRRNAMRALHLDGTIDLDRISGHFHA